MGATIDKELFTAFTQLTRQVGPDSPLVAGYLQDINPQRAVELFYGARAVLALEEANPVVYGRSVAEQAVQGIFDQGGSALQLWQLMGGRFLPGDREMQGVEFVLSKTVRVRCSIPTVVEIDIDAPDLPDDYVLPAYVVCDGRLHRADQTGLAFVMRDEYEEPEPEVFTGPSSTLDIGGLQAVHAQVSPKSLDYKINQPTRVKHRNPNNG